jgi:cytochrome P450
MPVMPTKPQGPKGYPYIGSLPKLASANRVNWLQSVADEYGSVSQFNLLKRNVYLVNHPDLVQEILTRGNKNYSKKTVGFKMVKVVLGESTFTAMGDEWRRKRLSVQPYFHRKKIANLATIMTECIEKMLDQWETLCDIEKTLQTTDAMMQVTLNVVVKALFSTALSEEDIQTVADAFNPLLEATNQRVVLPFPLLFNLPTHKNKQYPKLIAKLDAIIYRIIAQRKVSDEKPMDLLQMLMDATDEETGLPLSDEDLRNEAMTMFIAGHETTATAMSWLWTIVSQRPDIRENIEHEVDTVLAGRTPISADFANLTYCQKVFKETMRLYPPVPILPRHVENDDILGGYSLNGGSDVLFSAYLLHRHPDFWDQPEIFNPHRFDTDAEKQQHPYAYIPFGGGPRMCLGNNFAMMEAVFIIAMTTQRFRLNLAPNANIKPLISLTTRPKYGVPVILQRRSQKA